jgi:ribonuclease HII
MLTYLQSPGWDIGVDEVGRGCLLGPVVTCALILPSKESIEAHKDMWAQVKDSKKVTERKRKELYEFITKHAPAYGIGIVHEKEIDSLNILRATMKAMHMALDEAIRKLTTISASETEPRLYLFIDGPHFKPYMPPGEEERWSVQTKCVVEGDATYLSIAGASIIAKYTRDTYMQQLAKDHPELEHYGISKNKGYGTKQHMDALKEYGRTCYHRMSFRPVRELPGTASS